MPKGQSESVNRKRTDNTMATIVVPCTLNVAFYDNAHGVFIITNLYDNE
jgi:hypothetical protein